MKKTIISNIISITSNILTLGLYGVLWIVFAIANDLVASFGGNASVVNIGLTSTMLAVAFILAVINIITAIVLLIGAIRVSRGTSLSGGRGKLWGIVMLSLIAIVDIILFVLLWGAWISWIMMLLAIIYIICIVLQISNNRRKEAII